MRLDNWGKAKISDIVSMGYEGFRKKWENDRDFSEHFFSKQYINNWGRVCYAERVWIRQNRRIVEIEFVEPDFGHQILRREYITAEDIVKEFMIPRNDEIYLKVKREFSVWVT